MHGCTKMCDLKSDLACYFICFRYWNMRLTIDVFHFSFLALKKTVSHAKKANKIKRQINIVYNTYYTCITIYKIKSLCQFSQPCTLEMKLQMFRRAVYNFLGKLRITIKYWNSFMHQIFIFNISFIDLVKIMDQKINVEANRWP